MAKIQLGRYEADEGELPALCMYCGSAAHLLKQRTFAWHSRWIFVYPALFVVFWLFLTLWLKDRTLLWQPLGIFLCIVLAVFSWLVPSLLFTRRMPVRVPLCGQHQNHWRWRGWFTYGGVAGLAVFFLGLSFAGEELSERGVALDVSSFACMGVSLAGVVWLIALLLIQTSVIHPTEITDISITLTCVSPRFAAALKQEQEQSNRGSAAVVSRPRESRRSR
jgi:hypothetical protein